jgi:FAD/FMN-containing dehydrogenase
VITDVRLDDYQHDGTFLQHDLRAAVLPADTIEVSGVLRFCSETQTPVICRGAGSGLVGGPVPLAGGIVLGLERLTNLEVDSANLVAVAGAGVLNASLDDAAAEFGLNCRAPPSLWLGAEQLRSRPRLWYSRARASTYQ